MTTVSVRMEDEDKAMLDKLCQEMGINISTFFTIYTKKVLRDKKIPFLIEAPNVDFYAEVNIKQIEKSKKQIKNGKTVSHTIEELEQMENE